MARILICMWLLVIWNVYKMCQNLDVKDVTGALVNGSCWNILRCGGRGGGGVENLRRSLAYFLYPCFSWNIYSVYCVHPTPFNQLQKKHLSSRQKRIWKLKSVKIGKRWNRKLSASSLLFSSIWKGRLPSSRQLKIWKTGKKQKRQLSCLPFLSSLSKPTNQLFLSVHFCIPSKTQTCIHCITQTYYITETCKYANYTQPNLTLFLTFRHKDIYKWQKARKLEVD